MTKKITNVVQDTNPSSVAVMKDIETVQKSISDLSSKVHLKGSWIDLENNQIINVKRNPDLSSVATNQDLALTVGFWLFSLNTLENKCYKKGNALNMKSKSITNINSITDPLSAVTKQDLTSSINTTNKI